MGGQSTPRWEEHVDGQGGAVARVSADSATHKVSSAPLFFTLGF